MLLAWLVLAAIPLQGFAAASMLYCGMGAHHASAQTGSAAQHSAISAGTAAPALHDHSSQGPMAEAQVNKTGDEAGKQLPDAAHKCGICASCCHSVAITEFSQMAAFAPLPQAESAKPFVLIHARPSPVPDKPPRV